MATRVREISRTFMRVTWVHTKRARSKAADYLANVAMDTKARRELSTIDVGVDGARFQRMAELLAQDTGDIRVSIVGRELRNAVFGTS